MLTKSESDNDSYIIHFCLITFVHMCLIIHVYYLHYLFHPLLSSAPDLIEIIKHSHLIIQLYSTDLATPQTFAPRHRLAGAYCLTLPLNKAGQFDQPRSRTVPLYIWPCLKSQSTDVPRGFIQWLISATFGEGGCN